MLLESSPICSAKAAAEAGEQLGGGHLRIVPSLGALQLPVPLPVLRQTEPPVLPGLAGLPLPPSPRWPGT